MLTFTPNSYGVLALPLLMHSTSGACRAYSLFLSFVRWVRMRPVRCSSSWSLALAASGNTCIWRCTSRCKRPTRVRSVRTAFFMRLNCLAWA